MSENKLDLMPLRNAVARLKEGLERYQQDVSDTQIRDGLIQRFEFTYEISHKVLKRYLESVSANPKEVAEMSFQTLIRNGKDRNLLSRDWDRWRLYRDMRARTSHTYDEDVALQDVALQVVEGIPEFLEEATYLLGRLSE